MSYANMIGVAVVATLLGVGAAGCTAPSEEAEENTESAADEIGASSCAASLASGAVNAKHRALLDTIAFTEGTRGHGQDGYDITFAYHSFTSCAQHPNRRVCAGAYCSTAAGRYQFLTTTWRSLGYANFGPANQDRGGMKLVSRRGANVPTTRAMTATEFANTMNRISYEWASLPPGRYGQPSYSMAATRRKYCAFAGC